MENTVKKLNLAEAMRQRLPAGFISFIKKTGDTAGRRQQRAYLVGGAVRDLRLGRDTLDIDLVVEGDAIALAEELSGPLGARLTVHPRFGTATLKWGAGHADIASARAETYARPGALPSVRPGTIRDDLARRDFTINAMAVELNPRHYGDLLDPHGGWQDLVNKTVRVLHEKSFTDDATRIWRAIRYEQRLDFRIDPMTLLLLKRDLPMLATLSGDRVRHELELVLREAAPEKVLLRAGELGVLERLHPALGFDEARAGMFAAARERYMKNGAQPALYLALLGGALSPGEIEELINYLHPTRTAAQALRETAALREKAGELAAPGPAPSRVYALLHGYGLTALAANALGSDAVTAEQIELYLNVLRHVKPLLGGGDLKKLGVPEGPKMKEVLQALRAARLDGLISSKAEEEDMVRGLLKQAVP